MKMLKKEKGEEGQEVERGGERLGEEGALEQECLGSTPRPATSSPGAIA